MHIQIQCKILRNLMSFNEASVIVKCLADFSIMKLDRIFSDGHVLLALDINIAENLHSYRMTENKINNRKSLPKWENYETILFPQNLDMDMIF